MQNEEVENTKIVAHKVWDRTTRWFHWINLVCVLILTCFGLMILYDSELGISGEGKILLKTLHVYVGYVFAINLLWRLVWAFIGSKFSRWRAILPGGKGFWGDLKQTIGDLSNSQSRPYLGHDPMARLMITFLLLLMVSQATTGLVLAGTDVYMPPFGFAIADWVTGGDPVMLANLQAGSKEFVDPALYDEMRAFRKPFVRIHEYGFYVLAATVLLHIAGVVLVEVRKKQGLVSAMISGEKHMKGEPVDK